MAAPDKPVRKRIVPELILSPHKEIETPSKAAPEVDPNLPAITDIKSHAEVAQELLGPGRKIYVDLTGYLDQPKVVNWKGVRSNKAIYSSSSPDFSHSPDHCL
jgi:hypothetical protein